MLDTDSLLLGALWYVVLLFSLVVHEAAHAWTALRMGDPTAYLGGQVTLDPMPHIRREPFGTVLAPWLFYLIGPFMIGWASTPFDPAWADANPRRAGWMSLAGPAANLLLVVVAGLLIRAGLAAGVFAAPEAVSFTRLTTAVTPGVLETLATLLSLMFTLNLLLFVFNLLPFPPLDGAGVVGLLLPERTARWVQDWLRYPAFALGGLLIAWVVIGRLFGTAHLFAINLLYPEAGYH